MLGFYINRLNVMDLLIDMHSFVHGQTPCCKSIHEWMSCTYVRVLLRVQSCGGLIVRFNQLSVWYFGKQTSGFYTYY